MAEWYMPGDSRGKYWGESDDAYWKRTATAEMAKGFRQPATLPEAGLRANVAGPADPYGDRLVLAGGVGSVSPSKVIDPRINAKNRWVYDAAIKQGMGEADAVAAALGEARAPQATATTAMNPAAPVAAASQVTDPYDRWLNDPQIREARNRLSGLYAAEESRVNPYATDSPAYQAMVKGQQEQAARQFSAGEQQLTGNLMARGATSGAKAASRAAFAGGAAGALADIATSAAKQQYERKTAWEDRRSQAMQNLARDAASVGLGVTGQGIGVTSSQQELREGARRFDVSTDEGRRQFDATMANRKDEFARTFAQADQAQKAQLALAYSQLSQQGQQFADKLAFDQKHTLAAEDQQNLAMIQAIFGALGGAAGGAVSAMKGG